MYVSRPLFRPWRSLAAIVLAYPIGGGLYGLAHEVQIWIMFPFDPLDLVFGPLYVVGSAVSTLFALGFPIIDFDTNERVNLYPIIIPTALVLLALAMRTVRFGPPPQKPAAQSEPHIAPPA